MKIRYHKTKYKGICLVPKLIEKYIVLPIGYFFQKLGGVYEGKKDANIVEDEQ